jgi:cysteine synthase B
MPSNASPERKKIIRAYGANLILTSPLEGTDGAQRRVREIVGQNPDQYFYPDQYNNDGNWKAHYYTTAEEVIDQTEGRITHFIAGLGTTATFIGISRRLKEFNPAVRCISLQPDSPIHGLEGLKHLESAIVPGIYDATVADLNLEVSTEEAYSMVKRLARKEGLFVGVSSGAALSGALRVAHEIKEGVVVTIFPDGGTKYLNEHFWDG